MKPDKARLEELKEILGQAFRSYSRDWGSANLEGHDVDALRDITQLIDAAMTEPSEADVAEAIDYFNEVLPYMAECDGEKHYKMALACIRQYQKPTDEADVAEAIKGLTLEMDDAQKDQHYGKASDLWMGIQALRQMGSTKPCEECKNYANDFYFCPFCGRRNE